MVEPGGLERWIAARVAAYTAPSRRGVPRGLAVGFSAAKFRAAAWSLSARSLADVAAASGVSYGQLTVWRTHAGFKAKVAAEADAFVALVRHVVADAQAHDAPSRGRYVWPDGSPISADAARYGEPLRGALHRFFDTETDADVLVALAGLVLGTPAFRPRLWAHAAIALGGLARDHLLFLKGRSAAAARAIHALEMQQEALSNLWADAVEDAQLAAEFAALPVPAAPEEAPRHA